MKSKRGDEGMDEYLSAPIKEVVTRFPEVGRILEEYQIGCVPCSVGTCLLKDVIEIHDLPEDQAREMMTRIANVIDPDGKTPMPRIERGTPAPQKGRKYSPPMKTLVDEHVLIKRWITLIPQVLETIDVNSPRDMEMVREGIDFIRSYADRFHHAKEEDILFKYFDENAPILKKMLDDHATGRGHVRALIEAVEKRDKPAISEHLLAYGELLKEHIREEDEILYPWMDRNLSTKQVGELHSKFGDADVRSGEEVTERCRRFVDRVEKRLQPRRKEKV
jgi:hemerythrin-like domain-containing protein